MPNDVRDLPAGNDGLYRFLGGTPLAVAFRLILLSILVGVVLAAIGFDPWNILHSIRMLFQRLWDLGFDAVNWLWRYFLLGAVHAIAFWVSVSFLTPLVLLVALFNDRKRLLHDIVLGTVVINNPVRADALRATWR